MKKRVAGWTGFAGKTLWDWLNLLAVLAVPLAVATGTIFFMYQQGQLSDIQHQHEVAAANLQHVRDVQTAGDQQRQVALKTCEDDIKDLLLTKGLHASKQADEVRVVARAEVISTLRQLDGQRKGLLMQFLYEASLVGSKGSDAIVSLWGADLGGSHLESARLEDADLSSQQ